MRSLRLRITVSVIAVAVVLIGVLSAVLFAEVARRIRADFDRRLVEDGRVVAGLVEWEEAQGLEFDFGPVLASFERDDRTRTWFRISDLDGTVLATSNRTLDGVVATSATPTFDDAPGPDGRVRWTFTPVVDVEDNPPGAQDRAPTLSIELVREAGEVDSLLTDLAGLFWLLGTSTCLLVGGVAAWQVTRSLAPVRDLAARMAGAGVSGPPGQLPTQQLPAELVPFVRRFDELLERVRAALDREREFSGHVAHELRTPLAVLRTGLELTRRRLPEGSPATRYVEDGLETVDEMGRLVDNLLMLARVERGAEATRLRKVPLKAVVDTVWGRLRARAQERELTFENEIPDDREVSADAGKLHIVVQNLLDNAVSYTERGGSIVARSEGDVVVAIWDSGPPIPPEELERVFDRLWRADLARTDTSQHAGLGLSLAKALCGHMRMQLRAQNTADGGLEFAVVPREDEPGDGED